MDPTNVFFGHLIDPNAVSGKAFALLLAVLLGGLIGLEREWRGNAAGMRTHILVCVGATIITITSVEIGMGVRGGMRGDPGHIAAQIVSGVGFLGAGTIMRDGATVRGLTTAASIWATAGIGIALGASPHLAELAILAAFIVLVTLTVLTQLETLLKVRQPIQTLEMEVHEQDRCPARVLDRLSAASIIVYGVESQAGQSSLDKGVMRATRHMRLRVQLPRTFDRSEFNTLFTEETGVISFHLD